MLGLVLLILLILFAVGSAPAWPYSRNWGYGPSGLLGLILVVLLIMMLFTTWIPAPWHGPAVIVR